MRITFLGPATVHLSGWLRAFQEAGVDVTLITCHRPSDFADDLPLLELTSRFPAPVNLVLQLRRVRRAIAANCPDLVVAYYASSYGVLASLACDRPYVVVTAGSDINATAGRRPYLVPLVWHALRRSSAVVCWSDSMKDTVLRFGVPPLKVFVLPRGICRDRFTAAPASPSNGTLRLVSLRRFRRIFHYGTLIEACRLLSSRGVRFHLSLCGYGDERGSIEARIAAEGLADRIAVLGYFRHDEVPQILRKAQVYVALPEIDGASASLFEAMSAGLYPVVSDIPANRQWIRNGVNGALVKYDDPVAVAMAIERVAREPALRQNAVERNVELVKAQLDIKTNTRKFVTFFDSVVREASISS